MTNEKYGAREELARRVIEKYLETGRRISVRKNEVPEGWRKSGACFVTLKTGDKLRGCIGNVEPFEPLYKNIVRNAAEAAFSDPRFPPLSASELKNISIEVSVLSAPQIFQPKNTDELLKYLRRERPGLIMEKFGRRALFLPQVWEELPEPGEFLTHLCLKAGLKANEWKDAGVKYRIFKVG